MMRAKLVTVVCFLVCLAIAIPMVAQQRAAAADPLTGTWTGDWWPSANANDRNQVSVELKFDGKTGLTGTVKTTGAPARPDVTLTKSTFTAATSAVHMEADVTSPRAVHFIIDGKLTGTSMAGSWNHDAVKGDFKLTKKP